MASVFQNIEGEVKNYCPVGFLSVVTKIFEQFVNTRLADHLSICCLFSNFLDAFCSS